MATFSWPEVLVRLVVGEDLDSDLCRAVMGAIVSGEATDAQIAGFAVALRAKNETAAEVDGLVAAMLEVSVPLEFDADALDIVGTGGDLSHSINISTLASLVAAGAGATVIKHGNRAASSKCGSADVLAELGVKIDLPPAAVLTCVEEVGVGFCFAPVFHPALRFAGPARRELGIPTVFNILGPLANPAQPSASLIGAADQRLAPVMARVFAQRGRHALVVRGHDGMDEVAIGGDTDVWDTTDEGVRGFRVGPTMADLPLLDPADLRGGDAAFNAATIVSVLEGGAQGRLGAVRQAAVLNAAAALVAWDAATGTHAYGDPAQATGHRLAAAIPAAEEAIDSGRARDVLARWSAVSSRYGD